MGFFEPSVLGGGGIVIALMIMKFRIDIKLDVFYTAVTKSL